MNPPSAVARITRKRRYRSVSIDCELPAVGGEMKRVCKAPLVCFFHVDLVAVRMVHFSARTESS